MSRPYRIVRTKVTACEGEEVRLAEIAGRAPVAEMETVLVSDWARAQGWARVRDSVYARVAEGVRIEVRLGADGVVAMDRTVSEDVLKSLEPTARRELEKRLKDTAEKHSQALNQVMARAMAAALPSLAREMGFEEVEQRTLSAENSRVYEVELTLR